MRRARARGVILASGMLALCNQREKEIASHKPAGLCYSVYGHNQELYELRWA